MCKNEIVSVGGKKNMLRRVARPGVTDCESSDQPTPWRIESTSTFTQQ